LWAHINGVVDKFEFAPRINDTNIFMVNRKSTLLFEHLMGITLDNPGWRNILMRLNKSNHIYNNGFVDIYYRHLLIPAAQTVLIERI
jgi:hypothetical protein